VTHARRPRWPTLAALLALLPGCSWVHQRQALEPNGPGRLVDRLKAPLKAAREPAPKVNLRVDPAPDPRPSDGPPP
jgi:hypothetical protein